MKHVIIVTSIFLAIVGIASWYFLYDNAGNADIRLDISVPEEVKVGEPFKLTAQLSNESEKILEDVDVSIVLPDGAVALGDDSEMRVPSHSMGDIGPGSINGESFDLLLSGEESSVLKFEIKAQYKIAGRSRARFDTKETVSIRSSSPAIPVSFTLPEKVTAGEQFEITVKYKNDTNHAFQNLHLELSYPPQFVYKSADDNPDSGNNIWNIKELVSGEEREVKVKGVVVGTENSHLVFSGAVTGLLKGVKYDLTSEEASMSIAESPLSLAVYANEKSDYIAKAGENISYSIKYKNNSDRALENIVLRAVFVGEMFDMGSAESEGSLNSITNTFSWNAASNPELSLVGAGNEGEVFVSIKVRNDFPISRLGDKNYVLKVRVDADSPTVPQGSSAARTTAMASLETKVRGETEIASKGYYRDPAAGVVNNGPYPPRVNQTTQYTIHWIIKNYSTNISGVKLKSKLLSGAKFVKIVKTSEQSEPIYNPSSGEISWEIPVIAATKGIVSQPVEAIFQIEHTPAVNQIGDSPDILGETVLTATDDFTGLALSAKAVAVGIDLPDDTSLGRDREITQ